MKSRDIAIAGILLAIGAILRYLSNVIPGAIVANPVIALYCLALILIRPNLKDALGIGIVAGIMSALISHSIFPPANLISEPVGAMVCLTVYALIMNKTRLAPAVSTGVATLASGFSFLGICVVVLVAGLISAPDESFTIEAFVLMVSPIVIITACVNSAITQILYIPSSRILMTGKEENFIKKDRNPTEDRPEKNSMISFRNFSYTYPDSKQPSLSAITTDIQKGEFVAINGPTGAGKTTFCLAASGVLAHEYEGQSEGTVSILGKNVNGYSDMGEIGRKIGVVFDDADAQLIFTTVEEEILSGLENRGLERDEIDKRLEEIMSLTDITELRHRAPHTLSGGQKQRVALAATLAAGTECLILDEATAELDSNSAHMIYATLKRLKDEGKTIIVVEQKIGELAEFADSVIVIENGRIISKGKPDKTTAAEDEKTVQRITTTPNPGREPAIQVRGLCHQYGSGSINALNGIDLTIYRGELAAIIGENGSGKTTLAKHFNGLLRPTGGEIEICGHDTAATPVTELAQHVGLVFQNPDTMLFENTVEKEIAFGLKNIGASDDAATIENVLSEVDLSHTMDTFPRSMSRGERQRLAIACVTAMRPDVIVLDEPTTGLDPAESVKVMGILKKMQEAGHTIIMVSHDKNIVRDFAERTIVMKHGRIVSDTTYRSA